MPALTLADIEDDLTEDQALDELLVRLELAGYSATSWQKFSIPRVTVMIGAHILSKLSIQTAYFSEISYNESSDGEALTRFSRSRFANERQPSVSTQIRVVLACAVGDGPHTLNAGDVVITDATGNTFRNVEGLTLVYPVTLSGGTAVAMLFEAETPGAAANIATGSALSLVTTFSGVTATNPVVPGTSTCIVRDGIDVENDDALKTRNSAKWGALPAFELIADSVESIALQAAPALTAAKVDDQNPRGAGTFDVYLAGDSATAGATDVTLAQAALVKRVMGSDVVRSYAAPILALDLTGIVYFDAKYQPIDVQAAVESVTLVAFVTTIPLGGFDFSPGPSNVVLKVDLETEIKNTTINGAKAVKTVVLSTPATDLSVSSFGKVVRGTWSLTYVAVP